MKIDQYISISWKTCDKGCCEDHEYFKFSGTPAQAIAFAKDRAKVYPTAFKIKIFQSEE
jgi:hypothetical protein